MTDELFTDLTELPASREFENCTFRNCSFDNLTGIVFSECVFEVCNLSNANISQTAFCECKFVDCKLVGLNFNRSRDFGFCVHMENCNLGYCWFDRKKMYKSVFTNCNLTGSNFSETDLSGCRISNCDFRESTFERTNLEGVDFTTNINFLIDPATNRVKKAKFASHALSGLLYRYNIIIE